MNELRNALRAVPFAASLAPAAVALAGCPGMEIPFPAGLADGFVLPTEPAIPSPELLTYAQTYWPQPPTRQFDEHATDEALIHTFTGWTEIPCGARLEIRLAAGTSSLATNDSVRLELVGGSDPQQAFRYWTTIRNVTGSWGYPDVATLDLDLADLPPYVGFPTNILDELADGSIDLLVEDDTAVDHAVLHICYCTVSVTEETWGRIKAKYASR